MSFNQTINLKDYVNRIVEILKQNTQLNTSLTNIVAQQPPIEQSPVTTLIPAMFVWPSNSPIKDLKPIGRDSLDVASARQYSLEIYNVIIAQEIDKQVTMEFLQDTETIVRDIFLRNQRLLDKSGENPIASQVNVVSTPYVLRTDDPSIQAYNVIARIEVPIQLL